MPRCRPFKLVDAMILIAAAALGLASVRPGWNQFWMFWASVNSPATWQARVELVLSELTIALISLAVAYIWIRLIPPRLPTPDLIRQPGMLAIICLFGLAFIHAAISALVTLRDELNIVVALALGLSWGVACHRYRSRAEPGWIEVLGRSFGIGLVVAIAASCPWYLRVL